MQCWSGYQAPSVSAIDIHGGGSGTCDNGMLDGRFGPARPPEFRFFPD